MLNGLEDIMTIYDEMNAATQQNIMDALIELLQQRPLSKLSIQTIADKAAVNRGTVYVHFVDKYAILETIEQRLIEGLEKSIKPLQATSILEEAKQGIVSPFSTQVFQYIEEHQQIFRTLLLQDVAFTKKLRDFFMNQFIEKKALSIEEVPISYIAAFAASAFLGVVEQWLTAQEVDGQTAATYFINIILGLKEMA